MEIRYMIVKEYLESLTEKEQLNKIFPILLESKGFQIITKPTENLGLKEYGKDIIAIGIDEDGVKKRFYFELKGGADKDITEERFNAPDGIASSLNDATYVPFVSQYPRYNELPLKIVIVHNGIAKGNVTTVMNNMFVQLSRLNSDVSYDRWDISALTKIFTESLFNAYLLTNAENVRLFNKTLINLDTDDSVSRDFQELISNLLDNFQIRGFSLKKNRNNSMVFESLKLVSFIIFSESGRYNNLNIAKKYILALLIKLWYWILITKQEENRFVKEYFNQLYQFYFNEVLQSYFERTLPLALKKHGMYFEKGGMYEEIGYNYRTFEFFEFYIVMIKYWLTSNTTAASIESARSILVDLIRANRVIMKPLIDYHSNIVIEIINLLLILGDKVSAKNYLRGVLHSIRSQKKKYNILPDANNNIENVIKIRISGEKSVFYSDSTSPLLAMLFIYIGILDLEKEFNIMRNFVKEANIDVAYFVPHHGINSTTAHLIEDREKDFEELLFSKGFFNEGYQTELLLDDPLQLRINGEEINFTQFKEYLLTTKRDFEYDYRTQNAGFPLMREFAHIYFQTPLFPDSWNAHLG